MVMIAVDRGTKFIVFFQDFLCNMCIDNIQTQKWTLFSFVFMIESKSKLYTFYIKINFVSKVGVIVHLFFRVNCCD